MASNAPVHYYLAAKQAVLEAGFGHELVWQASRDPTIVTESEFLCEAAWVILSSGFSERTVRTRFPQVSSAFFDFRSACEIAENAPACYADAMAQFRHHGKVSAIVTCAVMIAQETFDNFRTRLARDPIDALQAFPYIGAITAYHLAKNIGFAVVKPDRHLARLAARFGADVNSLCERIASYVGDPVQVVDLVLWRFAVMTDGAER